MAFTVNKKAICVLEFAKTESIVTLQRRFRIMYHTEPPTDKIIREWYMNSSRVAACAPRKEQAVRAHRPGRPEHYERYETNMCVSCRVNAFSGSRFDSDSEFSYVCSEHYSTCRDNNSY